MSNLKKLCMYIVIKVINKKKKKKKKKKGK